MGAHYFDTDDHYVVVTSSAIKSAPRPLQPYVEHEWTFDSDIQLSSQVYSPEPKLISIGGNKIGGTSGNTLVIAGPCAVESYDQIDQVSRRLVASGINTLRGGCYKPRTSPYTFQGLGDEGVGLLIEMRRKYGLSIVTEARDASNVDNVIRHADMVQIGTKSMYDYALLSACGDCRKPILLKRNFGATLREFLQCAEFIMSRGNDQVILCERGIRTFENGTRFTLDLCGVAWLKHHTSLPIIVDPSHAMGKAYGIPDLARASVAMDIDGLMLEIHPDPSAAKSDARQQLDLDTFSSLLPSLRSVAAAIGRTIK